MDDQNLIEAINELKESIDSLTAIHNDQFNVDTSHDDILSLKGELKELRKSIGFLNVAINDLNATLKTR